MVTTRGMTMTPVIKRRRQARPSASHSQSSTGITAADLFLAGTVLSDWLVTACEEGKARAAVGYELNPISIRLAFERVQAQVQALETLGLLLAAGLGTERHLDVIAGELNNDDVRIRKAAASTFTMLPACMAEPHLDALFELLAGSGSFMTRNTALTILSHVSASSLEIFIDVKLRAGGVWRTLGWFEWARGLWAMTTLSSHALTRQLVTMARAAEHIANCPRAVIYDNGSDTAAAWHLLLKRLRERGKGPEGCDDWWSEGEVVALVRLLKEPSEHPDYKGVTSVLRHIDPTALCLGVPELLGVVMSSVTGDLYIGAGNAAVHALDTFAYSTLPSEKVPPPPPIIAREIAAALRSKDPNKRAAAATAVGALHRRLAEPHYPRLWELLNDRDGIVRMASSRALRDGAGEVEVRPRLKEIRRKIQSRRTCPRELCELIWVLSTLSKPWPSYLASDIMRICIEDGDGPLVDRAYASLNSFTGRDLSATFSNFVRKVSVPTTSVKCITDLLAILKVEAFDGFIEEHARFVVDCLGHSTAEVCDSALKLLWRLSADVRKPYLGVVASAVMRQDDVNPSYVKMLGAKRSGLTVSDLAPVIQALESESKRLTALTVLRGLTMYHSELLRRIMSPVARCLHDAEDLVRVMTMRVISGARPWELEKDAVYALADQLLHADRGVKREAVAAFDSIGDATVGLLGPWLVEQLLRVPQHDYSLMMTLRHLLTKVPDACMPAHVEALLSALESGCAGVQATAVDTLMALWANLLEPMLPRMEALISQHDTPPSLRGHLLRIALRVPPTVHTSTLADAVVAGISAEAHPEVREACVAAIETLRYDLLHQRAGCVMSGLLTVQPLHLVESGASHLLNRADEGVDGALVEAHLGMVLEALKEDAEETSDRVKAAFMIAQTFSTLCVRSRTGLWGQLLQHAEIKVRRHAFALIDLAYSHLGEDTHLSPFGHPRLQAAPPLIDAVADALGDPDLTVRACAQEAMYNVLVYLPPRRELPRQKIVAALLEYGHTWDGDHVYNHVCAIGPELQERLLEGDDTLRLKILKLLKRVMRYEIQEDFVEALKRIVGEGSLSTRLIATNLLRRVVPKHQEIFDDGYVPVDYEQYDEQSDTDEDEDD